VGYTKRELITAAFEEVGLASYVFDLQPEQIQSALRKLDSMAAMWEAKGILLGYPMVSSPDDSDLDSDSNAPDSANEAIILNLGIRLAPSFGKSVAIETRINAKLAYDALLSAACFPIEMQLPRGMTAGAGHKNRTYLEDPVEQVQVSDGDILSF
tara:strand:- start:335 stop:799 length:465 start_codon:yes stop_codon:yes gene_type:complete